MGQIMQGMASQMQNLARHLEQGNIDPATQQRLQEQMRSLQQRMHQLENEGTK
jgi:hypothetical protein